MTEPKTHRSVKRLIAVIQDKLDRDVELFNKENSELDQVKGQLALLGGILKDTQTKFDVANQTHGELLRGFRERSGRIGAMRELLKSFK